MLRTRLAPSPTGYLHLGHVVNALYVQTIARTLDAEIVVRIENHDRVRCRPEYERAMLEDLAWLGLVPEGAPAVRQTDRDAAYRHHLSELRRRYHVYACDCSRADVRRRSQGTGVVAEERYDGFCRDRGLDEGSGRGLRVELDPVEEVFDDLLLGRLSQQPWRQSGDLLLRDRDGHWTYHYAVTVDDLEQGITHVVRGEDLLESTGRQIQLARMLGRRSAAVFAHHPLVRHPAGAKLSKAAGDTGIRELRARGLTPEAVIQQAAAAVGFRASSVAARIHR